MEEGSPLRPGSAQPATPSPDGKSPGKYGSELAYLSPDGGAEEGRDEAEGKEEEEEPAALGERLYAKGQQMRRRLDEQRLKAEEERVKAELQEVRGKPVITSKVRDRGWDEFLRSQGEWLRRKHTLLEKKKEAEVNTLEEDMREHQPKASDRSNHILRLRNYKGPVEDWSTREQHFKQRTVEPQATPSFAPTISPAAQQIRRKGPVSERLYMNAAKRQEKQARLENKKKEPPKDPQTGQLLFCPVTGRNNMRDHSPIRRTAQEIDMQYREMQRREEEHKRRLAKIETQILRERNITFKPSLNPRSVELIRRQGGHRSIQSRPAPTHSLPSEASPARPRKSKELGEEFFASMERKKKNRETWLKEQKMKEERKETEGCTFHPTINRRRGWGGQSSQYFHSYDDDGEEREEEEGVPMHYDPVHEDMLQAPADTRSADEDSFARWEEEWYEQQRSIEAALKACAPGPVEVSRSGTPPPAASTTNPTLDDQLSELKTVLQGWRQLEDQFSTSYSRLRSQSAV